jgi:hypothetical protein
MKYNFLNNSGLQTSATQSGHTGQKLFGGPDTLFTGIGAIISSVLGLVGVVFIILIMYGGYLWMTAQGNESQIEKAVGIMKAAVLGLVIVFAAFAISYFVMSNFGSDTLNG